MPVLSYEEIDLIADAYIPILAISSLWILITFNSSGRAFILSKLVISIAAVYLFMAIDNWLHIWPFFGLDYSTHTALSLVFVLFISILKPKFSVLAIASFIFYALLMLYQGYHSIADIVTTSLVISPILILILKHQKKIEKLQD